MKSTNFSRVVYDCLYALVCGLSVLGYAILIGFMMNVMGIL